MPGWSNSDNKFGPSSFIVGDTLDGCNYTSIQAAVNDAIAKGTSSVYVRPGLYVENITISGSVAIIGAAGSVGGDFAIIQGQITLQDGSISLRNINISPTAGNIALAFNTIGYVIFSCDGCTINGTGSFVAPIHYQAGGAESRFADCLIRSSAFAAIIDDIGAFIDMQSCTVISSAAVQGIQTNASGYQYYIESCTFQTSAEIHISSGVGGFIARYSRFNNGGAAFPAFALNNATSILNLAGCEVQCSDAAGEWVSGIGIISYADVVLSSTARNIGAGITVTDYGWRPYAASGMSPGTGVTRGTSCFDSSQFSVIDGFVQAIASGIFPWVNQGVNTTVVSNQGNFATAAITLTLPAAPSQGDTCKFKCTTAGILTVAANAGQTIQLGNQTSAVAGNITSTAIGDAVELTYYAAGTVWIVDAVIGNWTVN